MTSFANLIIDRNVIVSAIPTQSRLHANVYAFAKGVSEHLLPRTTAYHEIWLDKKLIAGEALKDVEPLYGEFYLPRKVRSFHMYIVLDTEITPLAVQGRSCGAPN